MNKVQFFVLVLVISCTLSIKINRCPCHRLKEGTSSECNCYLNNGCFLEVGKRVQIIDRNDAVVHNIGFTDNYIGSSNADGKSAPGTNTLKETNKGFVLTQMSKSILKNQNTNETGIQCTEEEGYGHDTVDLTD
jgi:hypothetical protein